MKNIDEGIFDFKKDKPKTGAITAADAEPEKSNDGKKSNVITTLKNYKTTYLKQAVVFISAYNKTDGEDEERILDKTVLAYKNYLVKMAKSIKKTAQIGVDKLGIKPLAPWWVNLFNAVEGFKGDVDSLIQLYNETVEKSKLSNVQKISSKDKVEKTDKPIDKKEKSVLDDWIKLIDDPKRLATIGTSFSKKLERFVEIFNLNESFINKMLEELDFEEEKEDDFEEAIEFITLARTGERDIGKVLKAWKDANPDKYKEKITKYYEKIKDDEKKKIRFEAAVSGKSSESETSKGDEPEKSSDSEKTSESGDDETLTLNKTKFVQGMKKISDNPDRFKKINREVLGASEGSPAYLSWDEFKKILDYIQNPESAEEKTRDTAKDIRSSLRLGSEE